MKQMFGVMFIAVAFLAGCESSSVTSTYKPNGDAELDWDDGFSEDDAIAEEEPAYEGDLESEIDISDEDGLVLDDNELDPQIEELAEVDLTYENEETDSEDFTEQQEEGAEDDGLLADEEPAYEDDLEVEEDGLELDGADIVNTDEEAAELEEASQDEEPDYAYETDKQEEGIEVDTTEDNLEIEPESEVTCVEDKDCQNNPGIPFCINGACVECRNHADCPQGYCEYSAVYHCKAWICAPNSKWCAGDVRHVCNDVGDGETEANDCGAIGCSDGVCNVEKAFVMTGNYTSGASVPDSSSLRITEPNLTLEAWVKGWSASGSNQILGKGLTSNDNVNYAFGIGPHNAKFGIYIYISSNGTTYTKWGYAAYTPDPTKWTHVAVVLDNANHEARYYINGRRLADVESWPTWPSTIVLPSNGALYLTTGYGITVDELRISDKPRYTATFTPSFRFEPDVNTRALWRFNEGAGNALNDATNNHNNGAVSSASWTDNSIWRNWLCAPGWRRCSVDYKAVDMCNDYGRWLELQSCQGAATCAEDVPWSAACR